MYIEPNTTIRLLRGVPLDNTYTNTIFFGNEREQWEHFITYDVKNFSRQSYQRVKRGYIRLQVVADDIYDYNYLMFQNTAYGTKWFYAFITSVEYINDMTSEIQFEIDVMQTWFFETTLLESFVEREHSYTDEIGDNILPEAVSVGEYINSDYETPLNDSDMLVLIMISDNDSPAYGHTYEGIYGGCSIWAYHSDEDVAITSKLNEYIQRPDAVLGVYMCPSILIPSVPVGGKRLDGSSSSAYTVRSFMPLTGTESFDGYVPKNKKLYTYPYNYLSIETANGKSLALRYEFFADNHPFVRLDGTFVMPVKLVLRPVNYKGFPKWTSGGIEAPVPSSSESLSLDDYPMCSWNVDTYKSWVAQNSVPIALNTLSSLAGGVVTAEYSAHPEASAQLNAISTVTNILSQNYTASILADQCRGTVANGNVNVASNMQRFFKTRKHITRDYAEAIDNFFSMYGYACNRIKIPNRATRPHWNYVKTANCNLQANAPVEHVRKICSIYNNGITFWIYGNEVGDYSKDNSPNIP